MALESSWADAPEEPDVVIKSPSKSHSNSKRGNRSQRHNNYNNNSNSDNNNYNERRSPERNTMDFDNYRDKSIDKSSSPVREAISFDQYRDKPINKSSSPVREAISFDQYRDKPINKRQPFEKTSGNTDVHQKRENNAYYTPPSSRGKPNLEPNPSNKTTKQPVSPSKLEIIKKRIEEQQSIFKVTKHKEQQKQLLDDFLNGDDEINWEDE
ncbi:similar to Saccharomyces cerevisiae YMR255W GFD1 Coiled-coiled protein of unknown function, identified as a high-copy suppressor of a dbp5 mutation [Maudiozyma barnettii]|mgnify:CR=1 FL=1|uniref:Uncharacterized protein n=1 Tax=Maudiozyma barnettii TaxID=61262 RepID=A0A8H2VCA6_9SACH|nr:Gfd1p [Kazachstania barnettii]CAB4252647.1 similar to Saccharomyces cerevisiae YMR255W GFD1 Coiled-coiled protein of unknown function, identified as a high-copy suppressor of a dbp5 mutation [Kazachstania barnettii]CAD1780119.1 similar to Saccharomyces cerevisiae YMR255W GFD1 Coiled-coiled protein of unknown function, identified as a high-copy suppressor of a dbp5 mutation [Kazachstania barnettii]